MVNVNWNSARVWVQLTLVFLLSSLHPARAQSVDVRASAALAISSDDCRIMPANQRWACRSKSWCQTSRGVSPYYRPVAEGLSYVDGSYVATLAGVTLPADVYLVATPNTSESGGQTRQRAGRLLWPVRTYYPKHMEHSGALDMYIHSGSSSRIDPQ